MAERSGIEWCDATWNPIVGCSWASPGCDNCYAARMAHRLGSNPATPQFAGLTGADGKWTGETRFVQGQLVKLYTWRKPKRIFVCSMGDLFHPSVPFAWIDKVFAVMALATQHTFMVLTKRPERMREYLTDFSTARNDGRGEAVMKIDKSMPLELLSLPIPNVWLGVTAENQRLLNYRVSILKKTPAAKRFVSLEPLLEEVTFRWAPWKPFGACCTDHLDGLRDLDWIICGGETGPGARPMSPDWVCGLRDQCKAAGVPFFFKQWGEYHPCLPSACGPSGYKDPVHIWNARNWSVRVGKHAAGRLLDGVEHNAFPEVSLG